VDVWLRVPGVWQNGVTAKRLRPQSRFEEQTHANRVTSGLVVGEDVNDPDEDPAPDS